MADSRKGHATVVIVPKTLARVGVLANENLGGGLSHCDTRAQTQRGVFNAKNKGEIS